MKALSRPRVSYGLPEAKLPLCDRAATLLASLLFAEVQALTPLRNKLLSHAFVFENYPLDRARLAELEQEAGLRITHVEHAAHETYDLTLSFTATESIELAFAYNASVHDESTIRGAADLLQELCTAASAGATLSDIANPGVFVLATDLLDVPAETLTADELGGDGRLMARLEGLRRRGAELMGLDPRIQSIPKIVLIATPGHRSRSTAGSSTDINAATMSDDVAG